MVRKVTERWIWCRKTWVLVQSAFSWQNAHFAKKRVHFSREMYQFRNKISIFVGNEHFARKMVHLEWNYVNTRREAVRGNVANEHYQVRHSMQSWPRPLT